MCLVSGNTFWFGFFLSLAAATQTVAPLLCISSTASPACVYHSGQRQINNQQRFNLDHCMDLAARIRSMRYTGAPRHMGDFLSRRSCRSEGGAFLCRNGYQSLAKAVNRRRLRFRSFPCWACAPLAEAPLSRTGTGMEDL